MVLLQEGRRRECRKRKYGKPAGIFMPLSILATAYPDTRTSLATGLTKWHQPDPPHIHTHTLQVGYIHGSAVCGVLKCYDRTQK